MITKINDANKAMYDSLFRLAEERLGLAEGTIVSMDGYLTAIEQLGRRDPNNYDLLRLPYTDDGEPLFVIDANAREINVPKVFKDNGLVVQGDHLSEIVWFKIDRYFDMMDFYLFANDGISDGVPDAHQGMHCYIEWFNPAAKDEAHQRGVDFAYAMTCDEDYVYFGWPIGNKLSGEVGTLQFAVRFLSITENETLNADGSTNRIDFNYSTKVATCDIKATLDFNLLDGSIAAESWEDILYTRNIYSHVINSTVSPAPIILLPITTQDTDLINHEYPINVIATTSTGAAAGTTQKLEFNWYKNGKLFTAADMLEMHPEWQPADGDDSETLAAKQQSLNTAMKNLTEGVTPGSEYSSVVAGNSAAKLSTFTAKSVGSYTVYVTNYLTKPGVATPQQGRTVYTGTIVISEPTDIAASYDNMPMKGYVAEDFELSCTYSNNPNGEVGYQWYKKYLYPADDKGSNQWTAIVGATESSYKPVDEGIYCCVLSNSKNDSVIYNTGTEADPSDDEKVAKADIRMNPQQLTGLSIEFQSGAQVIRATATHDYSGHNIEYWWFWQNPADAADVKMIKYEIPNQGVDSYKSSILDVAGLQPGKYYCNAGEVTFYADGIYQKQVDWTKRSTSGVVLLDYVSETDHALKQVTI